MTVIQVLVYGGLIIYWAALETVCDMAHVRKLRTVSWFILSVPLIPPLVDLILWLFFPKQPQVEGEMT